MLQLMNATTPALVHARASSHDVEASSGVATIRLQQVCNANAAPSTHFDPNLSVEELISKLVQDCFDNAVNDDADPTEQSDARAAPRQTSVDACDSDSGVSTISDTAPASVTGDVGVVEVDVASPCSTPDVEQPVDVMARTVIFGGRDVLDLASTLTDPTWRLQATQLPPMNLDMFWKNRSQYHRLGDFGSAETLRQMCCHACDFNYPVPT